MTKIKIHSGRLKGLLIESPRNGACNPMSERMRTSLFDALGELNGLTILDAYAGTGSIGITAFSNGAKNVALVERHPSVYRTLQQNITLLKQQNLHPSNQGIMEYLKIKNEPFDIVFADPPYDNIKPEQISELAKTVKPGGLFILSHPKEFIFETSMDLLRSKQFGEGNYSIYRIK